MPGRCCILDCAVEMGSFLGGRLDPPPPSRIPAHIRPSSSTTPRYVQDRSHDLSRLALPDLSERNIPRTQAHSGLTAAARAAGPPHSTVPGIRRSTYPSSTLTYSKISNTMLFRLPFLSSELVQASQPAMEIYILYFGFLAFCNAALIYHRFRRHNQDANVDGSAYEEETIALPGLPHRDAAAAAAKFKRTYFSVYVLATAADWLQVRLVSCAHPVSRLIWTHPSWETPLGWRRYD